MKLATQLAKTREYPLPPPIEAISCRLDNRQERLAIYIDFMAGVPIRELKERHHLSGPRISQIVRQVRKDADRYRAEIKHPSWAEQRADLEAYGP